MSDRDPPFMFSILAYPPADDDDEPPILSVEGSEREAHRMAAVLGGMVIKKFRRTDTWVDGARSYEHVEYLTPRHMQQRSK